MTEKKTIKTLLCVCKNKTMERTLIEQEIRKYNPQQIHFYDNRVIEWAEENPILSNVLMSKLSDEDIEELYINLKIGFLVFQFGIEKCEKVFNEFVERRCQCFIFITHNDTQIYLVLRFNKLKIKHEIMEKNRIKRFNENSELNISDVKSSKKLTNYIVSYTKDTTKTDVA